MSFPPTLKSVWEKKGELPVSDTRDDVSHEGEIVQFRRLFIKGDIASRTGIVQGGEHPRRPLRLKV